MKKLYITMALAILPFSSAYALSISTVNGDPTGYLPGASILYNFDTGVAPANLSGDFDVISIPENITETAAPWNDLAGYYLTVPGLPPAPVNDPDGNVNWGTAILTFAGDMNYLGLYWGSMDTYNKIDFWLDGKFVDTVSGSQVADPLANGNQTFGGTNRYVNITGIVFDEVRFTSTGFAFEVDNIAANPVPEPATMLLFGAGLAGLAGIRSRRKK